MENFISFWIWSISSSFFPLIIFSYSSLKFSIFFFIVLFQWFLIVLSVLPGKYLHNWDHLFPILLCKMNKIHSSSFDQAVLFTVGQRWLNHLSRHCFPIRSGKCELMKLHFSAPYFSTKLINFLSSCSVQGPLFVWEGGLGHVPQAVDCLHVENFFKFKLRGVW